MFQPEQHQQDVARQGLSRRRVLQGSAGALALSAIPLRASADPGHGLPAGGDSASIQQQVQSAYDAGKRSVRLKPGTYHVAPTGPDGPALFFQDLNDFRIDAEGVRLELPDNTRDGVLFYRCNNVTFRGATITPRIPPTTQGTITRVDGATYEFRVENGYPSLDNAAAFPANPNGYIFDAATLQLKEGGSADLDSKEISRLEPGAFRVVTGGSIYGVEPGDLVAFRGLFTNVLKNGFSSGMVMKDVRILNSSGFGLAENDGVEGQPNRYQRVTVSRGARPQHAMLPPLLGSTADAFNSSAMRRGPIIEDCLFEYMADDGIAIKGFYGMVASVSGDRRATVVQEWDLFFQPGDEVQLVDSTGAPKPAAVVDSVLTLPGDQPPSQPPLPAPFDRWENFVQLTFDRDVPLEVGDRIANESAVGNGYVIRNNTVRHHRARGMLLKARDGLVENNVVERSSIAGIVIGPESLYNESGYAQDLAIRGNTIVHTGYTTNRQEFWAAITVQSDFSGADAIGNARVTIEDNTIRDVDGVNMYLDGIKDSVVRENRIHRPNQRPGIPDATGPDNNTVIYVNRADGLHFDRNVVTQVGPANTGGVVRLSDDAHNVTGLPGGVRSRGSR